MLTDRGQLAWQATTGYGQRALIETTMGRYKTLIGPRSGPAASLPSRLKVRLAWRS